MPSKPHPVCQYLLPHVWGSSHLIRCSTRIGPWTCTLCSLHSFSVHCYRKAHCPSLLILRWFSTPDWNLQAVIKSQISFSPCRSVLMTPKPGWQWINLNSTTTRPKQWLYPLVESLGLSFPPSQTQELYRWYICFMSDCEKPWRYTWSLIDHENSHIQSGRLS